MVLRSPDSISVKSSNSALRVERWSEDTGGITLTTGRLSAMEVFELMSTLLRKDSSPMNSRGAGGEGVARCGGGDRALLVIVEGILELGLGKLEVLDTREVPTDMGMEVC